jgi:hypothetical protein
MKQRRERQADKTGDRDALELMRDLTWETRGEKRGVTQAINTNKTIIQQQQPQQQLPLCL